MRIAIKLSMLKHVLTQLIHAGEALRPELQKYQRPYSGTVQKIESAISDFEIAQVSYAAGVGINLRSLLDGELAMFKGNFSVYAERNAFIDKIEERLMEDGVSDWISLSNGTTFEKTFVPSGEVKSTIALDSQWFVCRKEDNQIAKTGTLAECYEYKSSRHDPWNYYLTEYEPGDAEVD